MIAQAIDDANFNKQANGTLRISCCLCTCNLCLLLFSGIENAEFVCGKAEDALIPILMRELPLSNENSKSAVAIVDPPRAGLRKYLPRFFHYSSVYVLRVMFVSTDPKVI